VDPLCAHRHFRIGIDKVGLRAYAVRGGYRVGRPADAVLFEVGGCIFVGSRDGLQYVIHLYTEFPVTVQRVDYTDASVCA
jgi:hypothetical protein